MDDWRLTTATARPDPASCQVGPSRCHSAGPDSARAQAESASFQAFINCYLREICEGVRIESREMHDLAAAANMYWLGTQGLQISLPGQKMTLLLDVVYHSLVGRHETGAVYRRDRTG